MDTSIRKSTRFIATMTSREVRRSKNWLGPSNVVSKEQVTSCQVP